MKAVCYGDSNTFGYDPSGYLGGRYDHPWHEILEVKTGWDVVNEGMNGREIASTSVSFPEDLDLLIIMLGSNDLLQLRTPEAACEKMGHFLESLTLDRGKILLIAPPPMKFGQWVQDQEPIDNSIKLAKCYIALDERRSGYSSCLRRRTPNRRGPQSLRQGTDRIFTQRRINYVGNWLESTGIYAER